MASILSAEEILPFRILEENSSAESSNPTDAVIFVGISLVLGIACRHVLRGTRVPYTVALLVLGVGIGSLEYGTRHRLGKIGDGIRLWARIDPDLLLAVFLPALLFESSFLMEVHQIKRCMVQMLLLAGPGVLISTFFLGSALKLIFPYNWSWKTSLLLGGLLSATDPVAVVALLKELGASKKLSTIIEGESLMNDGTAIVVYQLFYRMVLGQSFNWGAVIKFLAQVSLGALGIGMAFGFASVLWLGFIFNDTVIEITLTLAVSYVAYFTAQEGSDVSGVLTVMTLGMFYSAVARTAFKGESQQSLHHFWEMVAYIANTLIFILSGVVIAEGVLGNGSIFKTHENSWGYLALLYVFVQISRVVVVAVLFPFLQYFGYGLDWKEAIILVWSGLRGAVALALSLSVKRTSDNSSYITSDTGTLFLFLTGGIVFLTLIVNGSTTQLVLHILNMDKLSAAKRRILKYTQFEMLNKALEAFGDLGDDEELGPADWPTVKRYISCLNDVEGERVHPHISTGDDHNRDHMNLEDIRVRFLNGDSEIASLVIRDSEEEGEEAKRFLEEVRFSFPQVLRVVKTRQVTYSVLNHLISYVHNLEKIGLLEEKEMVHLHDAVQTDLKRLLRNPPLVKIPKIHDLINANPLLGALPPAVRETFVGCTKEIMKLGGTTLYREGSRPSSVWLISNGVVKWTSKSIGNKHCLHPTFTHGSTLGLYEVLAGKPCICDIVTDSVVLCVFIEAEKILAALKSDPAVEDFFWQESVIILSKLLLPQIFEKTTMQDLRALVAQKSIMSIYIRGETFEIPHHSVGFLLEGFIKAQGFQGELLTSPAALCPYGDQSFRRSERSERGAGADSFSHQATWYQVETRARVILFDIAGFEANRTLQRRSSSLISHSVDHPSGSLTGEHGGLMSWPEEFYKIRQHQNDPEKANEKKNNLSARAIQLSIFGSIINNAPGNAQRFSGSGLKPSYSHSYPRVPSNYVRPLFSARSEGSSTIGKKLAVSERDPHVEDSNSKEKQGRDDLSDESGAEDELIVSIDSPSRLSFQHV
ncbi:sodium/hydrogen exchanger 7-like isoform X5 [Coffea arabica]|uniref:Sodium/hydrogen exchanger 7-like isoform X5 n=1 Tax=Coffea arabica TaxID=13443 RepID=A0ABM4W456_COFAR